MKSVIILGATGFIGSYIADEIRKSGRYKVLCLIRESSDSEFLEKNSIPNKKIAFTKDNLYHEFSGVDFVINCQAVLTGPIDLREKKEVEMLDMILHSISGATGYLHLSSIIVYGYKLPNEPINEKYIPRRLFGEDKIGYLKEQMVQEYLKENKYIILQPPSTLGKRDKKSFAARIKTMYNNGKFPLVSGGNANIPVIDTRDIGRAFLFTLDTFDDIEQDRYLLPSFNTSFNEIKQSIDMITGQKQKAMRVPKKLILLIAFLTMLLNKKSQMNLRSVDVISSSRMFDSSKFDLYGFKLNFSLCDCIKEVFS